MICINAAPGVLGESSHMQTLTSENQTLSETSLAVRVDNGWLIDTRPIFDDGGVPCELILTTAHQVAVGQELTLLVPFEPVPLYMKLGRLGYDHSASQEADGTWRALFRRHSLPVPGVKAPTAC